MREYIKQLFLDTGHELGPWSLIGETRRMNRMIALALCLEVVSKDQPGNGYMNTTR